MSRNQLDQETSPYLLAHKDNPVHWRAWNAETLNEAKEAGKPILLSVGYTACHWCHVMNHESFTDPETAELMNELFIPVKVDREERPDIDQLYQTAANALGQQGGWPLTAFLTPDAKPYFIGSYFPKEEQYGQPAFKDVLKEIARAYREQPEPIANTTQRVEEAFTTLWGRDLRGALPPKVLDDLAIHVGQRFDFFYGGVTGEPKFPSTGLVEILWRAYLRSGAEQFNQLVQASLTNMSLGGIYDHVGGGYARYSLDQRWIVPHFEKMLYDNAQIVDILTLVWQSNRMPLYRDRVFQTVEWVLRDMQVEKAFASSVDADSEGEEGKYYVWTEAEIDAALQGTFAQRFKDIFNVEHEGPFNGKNILHRLGRNKGYPLSDADEAMVTRQCALLLAARNERTAPIRDDKVLADWNGMMIAALANAGAVFGQRPWTDAAIAAFDFICERMADGDRLFHSWRNGTRGNPGFADDYAQMARAALVLLEVTADKRFLARAQAWARMLNEHFWDAKNGGYCTGSDEDEALIVRPRMVFDQIIPSPNGVMVSVLGKLYLITGDAFYRDRCNALIEAFSGEVARTGISMATFIHGLENVLSSLQIVILGPPDAAKTRELIAAVSGRSLPGRTLILATPGQDLPEGHPVRGKTMENGQPTAYVCQQMTCSPPVTNPVGLSQMLQLPPPPGRGQPQNAPQGQPAAPPQMRN